MPFVSPDVVLRIYGADRFELVDDLVYEGPDDRGHHHDVTVPVGFRTDFASVPRPFLWLLPKHGVYTRAAILHDYLCDQPELIRRARADGVFREVMRELEVPFLRRWLMWAAVRLASRLSDMSVKEFIQFLLVAVPAIAFLAVPTVVILVWLALFWVVELLVFVVLRLLAAVRVIAHRPRSRPELGVRATR